MQDLLGLDRNDQLEYFFEISVDLMAIIGTDKIVKKVSKCCKELLGWSEEELNLSEWSNFVHEDDVFKVLAYIRNSNIKNGIKGLELRFKCKDESYRWIESNCRYVEESEVYILTARDITEKKQIMEEKIAYEKAIEGYQFQVGRYNIWMNYYAIFVGALFVALYSIWPKSEIETLCCACKPVCGKAPAAVAESQEWFLPLIISVLGWIASLCWYGALLGYRKWNEHWIKVVQGIEMVLNKDVYPNVYTAQPERPQKESLWKRIKNIFRCNKSKCYAPGFVSTQKITGIFIFFAALAWGGLITYILYQWCCGWNLWSIILSVLCGFLTVVLLCRLHWGKSRFYSSTIIDR